MHAPIDDDSELCQLIIDNLDDYAVIVMDVERRVRRWNEWAEKLLGYASSEILSKKIDLIFTPEDIAVGAAEQEAHTALTQGRARDNRWHVRADGSRFWGNGVVIRLDDGHGGVRGLAKILQDQTALKLAETERAEAEDALHTSELRFRRLIEANIIGVGISSAAGEWIHANDELLRILGCSREELRAGNVRWDRMTPDEFRPLDQIALQQARKTGACSPYEKDFVRSDGVRVPVLTGYASVSALAEHYVCFVLDLSRQKRTEQALREADRRKDEFLAMLAHELRNPLAPIRTAIEVLKHRDADDEMLEATRLTMERQVSVLVRLVDDLLDVSRFMHSKVELRRETVDVQTVVARAVETSQPLLTAKNHKLTLSMPSKRLLVFADAVRLAQVVSNLVNNAAKYTEAEGEISIDCDRDGEQVRITIRDSGIGIPPDRLPTVFDLFTQLESSLARAQGGLGIGLTLVKSIVEMHGGTVAVCSDGVGKGSEFTVRLPAASVFENADGEGASVTTPSLATPYRILVVDDNVDAATTLAMLLRMSGHAVETAFSAQAALHAVSNSWDIVFLDIGLPDKNGYEVAREIRQKFSHDGPILCALTGYGQDADRVKSSQAGFDFHFVKPMSPVVLSKTLADLPLRRKPR